MRSPSDLIVELEGQFEGWDSVALIVAFPPEKGREEATIFANAADRLSLLAEAVNSGGEPIGFIRSALRADRVIVQTRMLPEYENDQPAQEHLREMANRLEIEIGKTSVVSNLPKGGQA
jgi:hypothetical protein